MILEVCIDSYETALLARKYHAKRIELCSALSTGGLSPNIALTRKCAKINGIETHVMIRLREGNFEYSELEMELMLEDIKNQASAGAVGVVFGCLTTNQTVDIQKNITLVEEASKYGLECTFHRAFDFVDSPFDALESLINIGFNRILTSGGKATAQEGIQQIEQLVQQANGEIEIMAGSGINESNALMIAETGIDALHFSAHHTALRNSLGMGYQTTPDELKIKSISNLF